MEDTQKSIYLSLSAASRLLGVHSTTLRRWADAGAIPVYMTPGGHRRFARTDIEDFISQSSNSTALVPRQGQGLMFSLTQRAWAHARTELETKHQTPDWLQTFGEEERDNWRRVSQQLMGIVLRYVGSQEDDDEMYLEQARSIGRDYASNVRRLGIPLSKALEAALFFRDLLVMAVMDLPEHSMMHSESSMHLLQRISRVLNVVQVAVASEYENG